MDCLATLVGIFAKTTLSYCGLLSHASYTISVIGGFYIYIIFESVFRVRHENSYNDSKGKDLGMVKEGDTSILILTSLPMLGLFFMGIYSLILLLRIDDEMDARKAGGMYDEQ